MTAFVLLAALAVLPVVAAVLPSSLLSTAPTWGTGRDPHELSVAPSGSGVPWPADPALAAALLADPRVVLSPQARLDLASGTVDGRVVGVLALLAASHSLAVSVIRSGHGEFVAGTTRLSNHFFGRAVDVVVVDGEPVSAGSASARRAVEELLALAAPLRPAELGSPFPDVEAPGAFSDGAHHDHIHIGFGSPSFAP